MTRRPGTLHSGPTSRVKVRLSPDDLAGVALLLGPGAHRLDDAPAGYLVLVAAHPTSTATIGGRSLPAPCLAFEVPA